jgi:hypothetical protein
VLAPFFVPVFVQCFLLLSNILEGNSFASPFKKKISLRDIGSGRPAIATLVKLVFNLFFYFNSSARGNAYSVVETNKPQFSTESSMAIIPVHCLGQNRFR